MGKQLSLLEDDVCVRNVLFMSSLGKFKEILSWGLEKSNLDSRTRLVLHKRSRETARN